MLDITFEQWKAINVIIGCVALTASLLIWLYFKLQE